MAGSGCYYIRTSGDLSHFLVTDLKAHITIAKNQNTRNPKYKRKKNEPSGLPPTQRLF